MKMAEMYALIALALMICGACAGIMLVFAVGMRHKRMVRGQVLPGPQRSSASRPRTVPSARRRRPVPALAAHR